jgi:hypothetical protein
MSRFEQEWAVVPTGARWTAVLLALLFAALMGGIFLLGPILEHDPKAALAVSPFFLLTLVGAVPLAIFVLLVGYIWADSRRRGMNQILWVLLAIFIPNAIGIILYFILRDPIAVRCPSCAAPAVKGHAFCATCGAPVRAACPSCRRPVEGGWHNCAHCGAPLATPAAAAG